MKKHSGVGAVVCAAVGIFFSTLTASLAAPPTVSPRPDGPPFGISFTAIPGVLYDIEGSTNLMDWDWLGTRRARTAAESFADQNSTNFDARFYRIADLSANITIEGSVESADEQGPIPFALVSSSLDSATAYTDLNGRYVLRTRAALTPANVPFTLFFSKIAYRPTSILVTNPVLPRVDRLSLAGPSNNDFTNRFVIAGTASGRDDNSSADVEPNEPGTEPSVWYSFVAPKNGMLRFVVDTADFEPVINLFKGNSLAALQPLDRGSVSNYVETRIEKTIEMSVFAGERLQIRVGALAHPSRGLLGGSFEWRLTFTEGFRLDLAEYDERHGTVAISPAPHANGNYSPGTRVTLSATPLGNYRFAGWTGSMNASLRTITIVMDEAKELQAHFYLGNGSPDAATIVQGATPQGQALVPLDGVVWFAWRAPKDMPVTLLFDTTNFLHATAYAVEAATNLVPIANNSGGDHAAVQFRAIAGQNYKWAVNFESDEMGVFRFQLYESIVVQGNVSPWERFSVSSPVFPSPSRLYLGTGFEIWTRLPATPNNFPFPVTVNSAYYRPVTQIISSNDAPLNYVLTFIGPSNNDFTNAIRVDGAAGSVAGSLYEADTEAGEQGSGGGSVWYKFKPAQNGTLRLATHVNARDTTVWKGGSLSTLALQPGLLIDQEGMYVTTEFTVNSGRDNSIRLAGDSWHWWSRFNFSYQFQPGYPLYIQSPQTNAGSISISPAPASGRYIPGTVVTLTATPKAGYVFSGWTGDVQRTTNRTTLTMTSLKVVQPNFRLKNDNFAAAIALSGLPASGRGGNLYGTREPYEPDHCGVRATSSAWWKWTSGGADRDVVLDFDYVDVSALISVYRGSSLAGLQLVANNTVGFNERQVRFRATANTVYWIAVDAYNGQGGDFSFTIRRVDEARYRLEVPPREGGYVTADPEPDGNGEYASGTWVTLRARALNAFVFDHWLEQSSGASVIRGNTNGLRVRMDRSRVVGPVFIAPNDVRSNDRFTDRQMILPGAILAGTNTNATSDAGEPLHHAEQSGRSLWWSWTAERTAPVALSTVGSSFSNVLAVYTGDSVEALSLIAANAGGGEANESRVWFYSTAGVSYHIAVDGLHGDAGVVALRLVANEEFTLEFVSPGIDGSYAAPAEIPLHLIALNSDLSVTQVNVFTNGALALRLPSAPFIATLSNVAPGSYEFEANAVDVYGRTVSVQGVSASVNLFRFTTNNYFAFESVGAAPISISRSTWDAPASVYIETIAGTASETSDYMPVSGRVFFDRNFNQKTFTVPLIWDATVEPRETVELVLRSGPGMPIKDRAWLTIANPAPANSLVWIDDALPTGSQTNGAFTWVTNAPPPMSGARAHGGGSHGIEVTNSGGRLIMSTGAVLYQDVYLDPNDPPELITVGWRYNNWYWSYAQWGDARLSAWNGTWMGPLPRPGTWVRLAIPGDLIGNVTIEAMHWEALGGNAVWDRTDRVW